MLSIFINILSTALQLSATEPLDSEDPSLIVALRSVLDCLLLYNFDDTVDFGVGEVNGTAPNTYE